jgi:16S rRNA (guanine966-N2)-methyltransferase
MRGAIFDMLDALGADYARVLDLYAGTGALGIEALSRGSGTADFVELDAGSIAAISQNLLLTAMTARGRIHRLAAEHAATSSLSGPYTLVLSDPPYYDVDAFAAVIAVAASPLVDDATIIAIEHLYRYDAPPALGRLPLYRNRRHGDAVASIYAFEEVP